MSLNSAVQFASAQREKIFNVLLLGIGILYTLRLGYLQIIRGSEYLQRSETQAIKQITKVPFRGCMYDRHGKMIIQNSPSFDVAITPNDFRTECIPLLALITGVPEQTIQKLYDQNKPQRFTQFKILRDISSDMIAQIDESHELLPGVEITIENKRVYDFDANAAHLFGYRAEINEKQLGQGGDYGDYYRSGDLIGQTGLESYYETYMRGIKGIQYVAVNAAGQPIENFNKGKSDVDALEGSDLYLGIDAKLQEVAEKGMKSYEGGIVVMDPRNGEVMALVSKPDYDLRRFVGSNATKLYSELISDPDKPLFNRAMQTSYPPGSTWKMLMALAGLQEHLITEHTTINCPGSYTYGGRSFKCHGRHGAVNVQRAIHVSCNVFFYELGRRMGIDIYRKYASKFHFGERTGIDISNEAAGILYSREKFARLGVKGVLIDGRMVNLGIGQGEIGVTPLQMAAYCATLANKGTYYKPHVVRSVYSKVSHRMERESFDSSTVPVDRKYFDLIHDAMFDVCNTAGGTATNVKVDSVAVCGKTGTAQNPHGKDHSWFICFAPKENPTIAMCVMVENAGFGATVAAPIARDILDEYFHPGRAKRDSLNVKPDSTKKDSTVQH